MKKEVKLFDPKFVHFMWDDSLEGKEGFFADSINVLNSYIEDCDDNRVGKVSVSNRNDFPFCNGCGGMYRFFYYDPNYEVKWAYYKEGKKVQCKSCGEWVDCDTYPLWVDDCQYRIKPESLCEKEKQTCRPFKDCDELVKFWTEKYQSVVRPAFTMPLVWVKKKEGGSVCLITGYDNGVGGWDSCVLLEDVWIDLKELFDDFEFLDGCVIGVEE